MNMFDKSMDMLGDTEFLGKMKENLVADSLWQKTISISDTIDYKNKVYFISPKSGKEIDFVYHDNNNKRLFIEVKSKIGNRREGIVLTKDVLEKNKIPLALFLLNY